MRPMRLARGLATLLLPLALLGCQGLASLRKGAPPDSGEVLVYLQPLPAEAHRLKFVLQEAWAEPEGGGPVPLDLRLEQVDGKAGTSQRLLALGDLPPGRYRGLLLKVKRATFRGEEGEADLLLPEAPSRVELGFEVRREKPAVLFLQLRYRDSLPTAVRFSPNFAPYSQEHPTPAVLGYVAVADARHLLAFDKLRGQVVGAVGTGREPSCLALDAAGQKAYVAVTEEDGIDVVDLLAGRVTERITLDPHDRPRELLLLDDRRTLLVLNGGSETVCFVDLRMGSPLERLRVGLDPVGLVLDRTGRRALVFNRGLNSVTVIDVPGRSVVANYATETGPSAGQYNRRGDRLYVGHAGSPYLLLVDPVTGGLVRRTLLGGRVSALKVDTATDLLYVAKAGEDELAVYDSSAQLPLYWLRVGGSAEQLAIDAEQRVLYAVRPGGGAVTAVQLTTRKTLFDLETGGEPRWVSVTGER